MKAKYQIYKITLHSGEIYIGQHKGDVLTDGYIGSPRGKNGCNSYTLEDIARIEVIDFANNINDICHLETRHIKKYRKTFGVSSRVLKEYPNLSTKYRPGVCLNVSAGGEILRYYQNDNYDYDNEDDEYVIVQTDLEWNFIRTYYSFGEICGDLNIHSPSHISAVLHGTRRQAYGYRWFRIKQDEVDNVLSIAAKYKKHYIDHRKKVRDKNFNSVLVYTIDGKFLNEFDCASVAASQLGLKYSSAISRCLRGKTKTAYGYVWKYKYPEIAESKRRKRQLYKIDQYDLNNVYIKTFNCVAEIVVELNLESGSAISNCIVGKQNTAHGYIWKKSSEFCNKDDYQIKRRPVDQYDLLGNYIKTFSSLAEAAQSMHMKGSTTVISQCCAGTYKQWNGFMWKFHINNPPKKIEPFERTLPHNSKPVNQFDLNHNLIAQYKSISEASRKTNFGITYINNRCHNKRSNNDVFIWEFAS